MGAQMADGAGHGITRTPGIPALTPNMRGFDAAVAAGVDEVVWSRQRSASQKNINCSIAESIARFEPAAEAAKQPAYACAAASAVRLTARRFYPGGQCPGRSAACRRWAATRSTLPTPSVPVHQNGSMCHEAVTEIANPHPSPDTSTTPTGRCWPIFWHCRPASIFHSLVGLGGCPYAKGATGNVATEDVLYMLRHGH